MFQRSILFVAVYFCSAASLASLPAVPVSMEATSVIIQGKVVISGSTNLPEDTLLDVDISNTSRGFRAGDTVSVKGGRFSTQPLGPGSGISSGVYYVEISARMTDKQPESVLAAVGSRGEILKGPLVAKIAGWGGDYFAVEYSMTIHVGTQAGAERVDEQLRQEMQRFLQDLATLYEAGMRIHREYDMSDLNQLRACVVENGSLRDKAKLLRERVSRLDRMDHRTKLTMASNDAFSCVYCGGTGKDCINIPAAIKAVRDSLASGDGR